VTLELHTWVARARCACGAFLWTTPGSGSVVCACGASEIVDNVVHGTVQAHDDADFRVAVAAEVGVDDADLMLVHEGP